MGVWRIYGPDELILGMDAVRKIVGVGEKKILRMIAEGRFPRPVQAGSRSPPHWMAVTIAAWLTIAPQMYPDAEFAIEEEGDTEGEPRKK